MELEPFWSYTELAMRAIWCNVGSAMVFSFVIELLQLIFRCGLFEFDDMIHNTLGATIGYGVWWGLRFANKQLMKKNC